MVHSVKELLVYSWVFCSGGAWRGWRRRQWREGSSASLGGGDRRRAAVEVSALWTDILTPGCRTQPLQTAGEEGRFTHWLVDLYYLQHKIMALLCIKLLWKFISTCSTQRAAPQRRKGRRRRFFPPMTRTSSVRVPSNQKPQSNTYWLWRPSQNHVTLQHHQTRCGTNWHVRCADKCSRRWVNWWFNFEITIVDTI